MTPAAPEPQVKPEDAIAERMVELLESQITLHQRNAVRVIREEFGEDFLYKNKKNRWAIDRRVLKAFNRLTGDGIVWQRSTRKWRPRRPHDKPGRMQR